MRLFHMFCSGWYGAKRLGEDLVSVLGAEGLSTMGFVRLSGLLIGSRVMLILEPLPQKGTHVVFWKVMPIETEER